MKNRNLSLILFLLLIFTVNTIDAERNINSSSFLESSTSVLSFDISTFHTKDFYRINATLSFDNTTTLSSISAVILKAADGKEAPLNLINSQDKFYYGELYYNSQPPLGQMFIIVTYTSNQKDTVSKNVDNFIDGIPEIEYPLLNGLFSPINPTFRWKKVEDDKAAIKYRVVVSRKDNNNTVWQINDLSADSVKYNKDGKATEQLINRGIYIVVIVAYDIKNNSSYSASSFTVGVGTPDIVYPLPNQVITKIDPTFKWKKVEDNNAVFKYRVTLTRQDNNKIVWQINDLSDDSVKYNSDGNATELLTIHKSYKIRVDAYDNNNHESYAEISFTVGDYYYLENEYLTIKFNSESPVVEQYTSKNNGAILLGNYTNQTYLAKIYFNNVGIDIIPSVDSVTIKANQIAYHLSAIVNSIKAVSFDITYTLINTTLELIFHNVQEKNGYKLTLLKTGNLLTVRADQPGARLVFPEHEGRLIDVSTANEGYDEVYTENYGMTRPLLSAMLYHQGLLGVVKYDHSDMNLWARTVSNSTLEKFSSIGMDFHFRYAPTDFSKAGFIDVFDSTTTEMKVRISLLGDFDNSGKIDWMDGAKFIRNQFQSSPLDIYANSFMTQIGLKEGTHISTSLSAIKKIYNLTDHSKIWCDLHNFNDVRYPAWMVLYGESIDTNPEFGTEQEIKDYFRMVKNDYNTSLDLSDNYLDYYPQFPTYDPSLRVVREDGSFYPGWPFSWSTESYQLSAYDYAIKYGINRIKKTLARYPFQESQTHHIDGFSLVLRRNFSLQYPSSFQKFRLGDQLIINEFNKYGITLTSEGINERFVGSVGWFYHSPRWFDKGELSKNSQSIPLVQFIFHGKTLYGLSKDNFYNFQTMPDEKAKVRSFLDNLLLGSNSGSASYYSANNTSSSSRSENVNSLEIDRFYFIDIPWMLTNKKFMDKYEENGDYAKTTYDANTFVEVDYKSNTYTVQVDGKVISKDYTTIYLKEPNTFLIFSRDAKTITIPLPSEWSGKIFLQKLTVDGTLGNINYRKLNRNVIFDVEENTPYKLIRNDSTAISIPEKVHLISPANNSIQQPTTFAWQSTTIPAEFYELQVATDSMITNVVFKNSTATGTKTVFDKSSDYTKYFWRVRAKNSRGSGLWSDVFSFTSQKKYEAEIRLGTGQPGNGITQPINNPDAAYKTAIIKNSPCVYNDVNTTPSSHYLFFNIDDNKVFSGNSTNSWITIEYYDTLSTGQIAINYDSPGILLQDIFKGSPLISISNTRTWKAYTFNITDAFFANRQGGLADFRIYASGVMFIRRVYASNNDTYNFSPIIPTLVYPTDASIKSPVKLQFKWNDNLRASNYHFQLSKDLLFSNVANNDSTITANTKLFDNLEINTQYYWRVRSINLATQSDWSPVWSFRTNSSTDVKTDEIPTTFSLSQNYPNPFNPVTIFRFGIPKECNVKLEIYNVLGQKIVQLVDETKSVGYYSVNWNATNFASGVYIYKLEAISTSSGEIFRDVKKMLLIK